MANFDLEPEKYQHHLDQPERYEKTGTPESHSVFAFPQLFWLFASALLLLVCTKTGLSPDYLYDKWGIKKGLPQNTVRQILRTSDGYFKNKILL